MRTVVLNGWAASGHAWDLCAFRRERIFSYVEQLDALPERLLESSDDAFVLVGWSMGGSSALRLFLRHPARVRALVLVATTPRMMRDDGWRGMNAHRLEALRRGLEITKGDGLFGPVPGKPNPYLLDTEENLRRGLRYLETVDLREGLLTSPARAEMPVWIFQSERDAVVPAHNADFLMSVFPRAVVRRVEGAEHALPILIPEEIDAAVSAAQHSLERGN